jgi:hypothetical protein
MCFAEAMHRSPYGALGLIAASETSYSFVNDAYTWGVYDCLWPDFDPGYGNPNASWNLRPSFANASGKYYLAASSWPYNPANKDETYHLFHHHGDAFLTLYSQVPQSLTVVHDNTLPASNTSFTVTANAGSFIGLSVDNQVIGAADGTGAPVAIAIPPQSSGVTMRVTVTGSNYFRYIADVPVTGTSSISISMTPYGAPIQVPVSGGSFDFNIGVINSGGTTVVADVWCMVTLPSGTPYGPTVGPANMTFPSGFNQNRDRTQSVPAAAPSGDYVCTGFVGSYGGTILDQASFPFTKLASGNGAQVGDWANTGESLSEWMTPVASSVPESHSLNQNRPNPFNPTTAISYQLSANSYANLSVYDLAGRMVAELVNGWREAGIHEVTFDGAKLPSGIYVYRLTAGSFDATGKMVLMK